MRSTGYAQPSPRLHHFGLGRRQLRLRDRGPDTGLAQRDRSLAPPSTRLDMRRVGAGHGTVETIPGPMTVDPSPDRGITVAIVAGDIDGLAMAVTAGASLAAVQRVAGAGLEARSEALPIVIAKRAEHRPSAAVRVHRATGAVEHLPEFRIHAP